MGYTFWTDAVAGGSAVEAIAIGRRHDDSGKGLESNGARGGHIN